SFLELSINPSHLLETIAQVGPPGEIKSRIDAFAETIQESGKVDFQKDLLGQLGPRMVLYTVPGRSATTSDESFQASFLQGFKPQSALSILSTRLPNITLVAEVNNPATFGTALEGLISAANNEFKALALEQTHEQEPAQPEPGQAGAGGGNRGRSP